MVSSRILTAENPYSLRATVNTIIMQNVDLNITYVGEWSVTSFDYFNLPHQANNVSWHEGAVGNPVSLSFTTSGELSLRR